MSVITLQTIFFWTDKSEKKEFVFLLADANIEKFRLTDMTLSRRYSINFDFNSVKLTSVLMVRALSYKGWITLSNG